MIHSDPPHQDARRQPATFSKRSKRDREGESARICATAQQLQFRPTRHLFSSALAMRKAKSSQAKPHPPSRVAAVQPVPAASPVHLARAQTNENLRVSRCPPLVAFPTWSPREAQNFVFCRVTRSLAPSVGRSVPCPFLPRSFLNSPARAQAAGAVRPVLCLSLVRPHSLARLPPPVVMPGPFVDVVAVASPTTAAAPFKDVPGVVPVREGRSQSLTALPRRASTASVLTVERSASAFHLQQDQQQQQHARQTRRALSSATSTSLSLLQEELGYPRRAQVSAYDGASCSRRRSSVVDTSSAVAQPNDDDNDDDHRPVAAVAAGVGALSSRTLFSSSDDDDGASVPWHDRPSSSLDRDGGDEDENFMNYRRACVTGYSRDTDGVVYYEVIVKSLAHGPLSAYKVRRRYSEFRALHVALQRVMAVSAVTALARLRDDSSKSQEDEEEEKEEEEEERRRKTRRDATSRDRRDDEPTLPPLPDKGGVWSYLQFDSIPLLERRAKYFHAMLAAAQRHPKARASRLLNDFVGTPPDLVSLYSSVENSYVSLNRFAAPKLSFAIEIQERKEKAESIRRRRNSLHRQSFTGSLDASFLSSCPSHPRATNAVASTVGRSSAEHWDTTKRFRSVIPVLHNLV
uniref:PX domain-containing protein n=1 Tax=Peronospora matthiolae TaxID=2874970 RepID=A0AAV1TNM5_9STRA